MEFRASKRDSNLSVTLKVNQSRNGEMLLVIQIFFQSIQGKLCISSTSKSKTNETRRLTVWGYIVFSSYITVRE